MTLSCDCLQGAREVKTDTNGDFRFLALPPGTYRLDIVKDGFKTIIRTNLVISLGRTVNLKLVMEIPEVGETVEVIDRRPVVDTESNVNSITLNSDFLEDLPSGRSFQDVVQFLPGVTGGANPTINGGTQNSNQYYMDGASTTDPVTGTFSMNFNFDAIEDLEVITSGFDARYNQGLGGTINIVTKSGGNTFEGNFSAYYETSALQGAGDRFVQIPRTSLDSLELNGSLGGPIVKDRFWFFVAYRFNWNRSLFGSTLDIGRDFSRYPLVPRKWQSHMILGKLTASPFPRNKFTFTVRADPTTIDNYDSGSVYDTPESLGQWQQGGFSASLQHELQIGGRAVLTTQAFYQYSNIFVQPMLWKDCEERDANRLCTDPALNTPAILGNGLALNHGSGGSYDNDRRHNLAVKSDLQLSLDRLLGSHTIYAGAEVNPIWTIRNVGWAGNQAIIKSASDVDGNGSNTDPVDINAIDQYDNTQRILIVPNFRSRTPGLQVNAYVQERWNPVRGVNINLGARYIFVDLKNNVGDSIISQHGLSWGGGVNWDPFRDGKTSIRANFGQVVDPGLLMLSGYINQNTFNSQERYNWDAEQRRWSEDSARAQSPGSNLFHNDFVVPRSNELDIAVNREIARDFSAQVSFLYRRFTNLWEDDEVNIVWNHDGTEAIGFRNGSAGDVYRLRTPQDSLRDYWSVTLLIRKQLSDNFELLGSYTFSRLTANTSGRGSGDTIGQSSDYDNPTQRWHERGIATGDIPHNVKLSAEYDNPNIWKITEKFSMGYALAGVFDFRSGAPLNRLQYNDWNQGFTNYLTKRGTEERLPAVLNLDLRGSLGMKIAGTQLDIIVQVFNVLNSLQPTAADSRAIGADGEVVEGTLGPAFARVAAVQTPRRFELGVRFTF